MEIQPSDTPMDASTFFVAFDPPPEGDIVHAILYVLPPDEIGRLMKKQPQAFQEAPMEIHAEHNGRWRAAGWHVGDLMFRSPSAAAVFVKTLQLGSNLLRAAQAISQARIAKSN